MFIVKYFRYASYSIRHIYNFRSEKLWKVILFFLILTLLACFPYNYKIIDEGGFKNALFSEAGENFSDSYHVKFANETKFRSISRSGLEVSTDYDLNSYESYDFKNFTLVIDYAGNYERSVDNGIVLLYGANDIAYISNGKSSTTSYEGFSRVFDSRELITNQTAFEDFFNYTEKSFSKYTIIFSILSYTLTQIFMYLVLLFGLAWIYTFIKKSWDTFLTFKELFTILVFSMTPGAVLSLIVGLIPNLFSLVPVIMNFMLALISLLVMYKVARHDKDSHQGVVGKTRFIDAYGKNKKNENKQEKYLM